MREAGPYVAIVALLMTLGGALYGWATTQGAMQAQVSQLQGEVVNLKTQMNNMQSDFNGVRLEIARWMAASDRAERARRER